MNEGFIECPEVVGKKIESLRIYKDSGEGTEVQIDFPDGTSFNFTISMTPKIEAAVIRPGIGPPEILHQYELW